MQLRRHSGCVAKNTYCNRRPEFRRNDAFPVNTTELIHRLIVIRRLYSQGWTWRDLQCQMEEIFDALGDWDDIHEDLELPVNIYGKLDMGK